MKTELSSALVGALCLVGSTSVLAQQTGDALLPPNAKAGECYARVFVPPSYQTQTERVMVQPEGERVQYSEPQYEWVMETRVLRPEHEKLDIVPAKFEWVEERVMVKEASEELRYVAAEYEWVEERVLVKPAYTTWKKGRGLIERIDDATGEIMCRVEVPAVYKTVKKKVVKNPARTERVAVPAQYRTVKKQVMVKGPMTVKTVVPAKTQSVKVRKLVSEAKSTRVLVPAKFETVTKTVRVADGRLEWRSVLCETNAGVGLIKRIQVALKARGFEPGPIDGVVGRETMEAVERFQQKNKLSSGKLTLETINALGVRMPTSG